MRAEALEGLRRWEEAAAALQLAIGIEPSARRTKERQRLLTAAAAEGEETGGGGGSNGGCGSNGGGNGGNVGVLAVNPQLGRDPELPPPAALAEVLPLEPPLAPLCVLGGRTGSGKTALLLALRRLGEQVRRPMTCRLRYDCAMIALRRLLEQLPLPLPLPMSSAVT